MPRQFGKQYYIAFVLFVALIVLTGQSYSIWNEIRGHVHEAVTHHHHEHTGTHEHSDQQPPVECQDCHHVLLNVIRICDFALSLILAVVAICLVGFIFVRGTTSSLVAVVRRPDKIPDRSIATLLLVSLSFAPNSPPAFNL